MGGIGRGRRFATQQINYAFLVGGQIVPDRARLLGGRIDAQKKDDVAAFLTIFGLTSRKQKM